MRGMMSGMFCGTAARKSEEYREVVRRRMYLHIGMVILGAATIIIALLVNGLLSGSMNDHGLGFLTGAGSGLTAAGLVMYIKTRKLMRNEEKLNEDRLRYKDERILEISSKALRTTAAILLLALYIVLLMTVVFYQEFMWPILGLIAVFFITYYVSFLVYSKKM